MYKTEEIRVRDPYVVVKDGVYYMYRSVDESVIVVHKSRDLALWEEAVTVCTLTEDSWGTKDLWAPEVHLYKGKYYMFLSLLGRNGKRGTGIWVCDTPDGTFLPLTNDRITPEDRSCIDATLYVENGKPYIVYSADWPFNYVKEKDCYIGEIWAVELSEDLRERAGEPFKLFASDEAPCSSVPHSCTYEGKPIKRYGSDAPFLQRLSDGTLYLTWSPYPNTYIVGAAVSESGSILGEWKHIEKPIFNGNGGHAMFFDTVDGRRMMCIHCPERPPEERATFIEAFDENGRIRLERDK